MNEASCRASILYGGLIWAVMVVVYIIITVFLARYKLGYMESFLKSAKWIARVENNFGLASWVSRLYRLNILYVFLMFPKTFVKRGDIDPGDLYAIPSRLRYLAIGSQALLAILCLCLVLSHFVVQECQQI
jgi:hypothetical protein